MTKLAIYYETDTEGKDTGKVQIVDEEDDIVLETFNTEEEADEALPKMQAEFDRNDKVELEYSTWENNIIVKYSISRTTIREMLVNGIVGTKPEAEEELK